MLIQGGMISSGRLYTFFVLGWYWISCISSFWNTTLPGVVAMFLPILNALASVMLICSWPSPRSMSASRLFRPRSRFSPPEASVSRTTSGLVSAKFEGDSASMYWRVKKSTFLRASAGRCSTFDTAWWMWRAAIRYDCLT